MYAMSSHLITLTLGLVAGASICYCAIALLTRMPRPGGLASTNLREIITRLDDEDPVPLQAVPLDRDTLFEQSPQEPLVDVDRLRKMTCTRTPAN